MTVWERLKEHEEDFFERVLPFIDDYEEMVYQEKIKSEEEALFHLFEELNIREKDFDEIIKTGVRFTKDFGDKYLEQEISSSQLTHLFILSFVFAIWVMKEEMILSITPSE
jgi:hypothetical protein